MATSTNIQASDKFMGGKGYGFTVTCRRDCFPVGIEQYLHWEKSKVWDKMAKAMRYENPIVAVIQVEVTNEKVVHGEHCAIPVDWTDEYIWF